jgi:hypothetical protein
MTFEHERKYVFLSFPLNSFIFRAFLIGLLLMKINENKRNEAIIEGKSKDNKGKLKENKEN